MNPAVIIHDIALSVRDFLFPPSCPGCASALDVDTLICDRCSDRLETAALAHNQSPRQLDGIDRVSILLPYDELTRNFVHALKYHGISSLGDPLGRLMARTLVHHLGKPIPPGTLVVPVPLHEGKLRTRGYNQSERLAAGFAAFSGLTVADDLIARTRDTGTQTALDAGGRARNVAGAFRFIGETALAGQPVIIIDDVITTGSTVAECARALRIGGAGEVWVCAVASPKVGMD